MVVKRWQRHLTRRKFLATVGLSTVGTAAYARVIEPGWLRIGRHRIKVSDGEDRAPLKILQLSDLHASPVVSLEFIGEAVRTGLALQPDLICLTGDFITRGYNELDGYAETLKPLAAAAPTFACLGNHDGGLWAAGRRGYADTNRVRDLLFKAGVILLHNAYRSICIQDWELCLIGLGDLWAGELQPMSAFPKDDSDDSGAVISVVLSHNPDSKEHLKPYAWQLLLCGHTHGGQLRLPMLGTPFAPVKDRRFVEGLHAWDGRWIHVTRGVGNLHGVRFNCPPEVSLLTLV